MKTLAAALTVLSIFLVSSAFGGDRVIARVGSEAITARELALALEQTPDLTRQKALDLLIERRLVLIWASERNIKVSDNEVQEVQASILERNNMSEEAFIEALQTTGDTIETFRAGIREQITINKALGMALSAKTQITDAELQELYLKTYPQETVFEVSHILLIADKDTSDDQDASVKQEAEEILAQIQEGASFDTMARQYSQDPTSADKGGLLGTFNEGELLPELEKIALTLEPGESGGPVRTAAGYHILKLISSELSEPPPMAEVKSLLERNLMAQKEQTVRTRWLNELKEAAYIDVYPDDG